MPDTPTTAQISAVINGGELSAESLSFSMGINSFPTVKCTTTAPTDDLVKAPISAELLERIASMQQSRLDGVVEPDIEIEADDGTGGTMKFKGFRSAPILQTSPTSTIDQFSAIGEDARMEAIDLSIYRAGYHSPRKESGGEDGRPRLKAVPVAESGDVPGTIDAVTDILVGNFEASLEAETIPIAKEMLTLRHQMNTEGPLELWKEVLSNSDVVYKSWDKAFEKSPYIAARFTERIKETLTSKTPGFWNKIRALMAEFQMYYVPSFDGVGHFERADKKVEESDFEIEVSISWLSVADGSPMLLQPGGVVMMGAWAQTLRKDSSPTSPRIIAYAPKPLRPGFIQEEVVPAWLINPNTGVPVLGSEVDKRGDAPAANSLKNYDLKDRDLRVKGARKYKEEVDTAVNGIMTEMCEVIFKEIQLAGSTVVLTKPLDFKINEYIGKRVIIKVLAADGNSVGSFTAFLSGVTHSVDLTQGKSLSSSTQVRCTHARY